MNCWIQLPDYSSQETDNVTVDQALKAFTEFDWEGTLAQFDEREEGVKDCPPGIGFSTHADLTAAGAQLLHICPSDTTTVMFHFHRSSPCKILGFIPSTKQHVHSVEHYPFDKVPDLIKMYFEGRETEIEQIN